MFKLKRNYDKLQENKTELAYENEKLKSELSRIRREIIGLEIDLKSERQSRYDRFHIKEDQVVVDKVAIPRDVARAIEATHKVFDLDEIRSEARKLVYADGDNSYHYRILEAYLLEDRKNIETYFSALVNGYVLEKTPTERARDLYDHLRRQYANYVRDPYTNGNAKARLDGAKRMLEELGKFDEVVKSSSWRRWKR